MTAAQLYENKTSAYFGAVGHHVLARLPGDTRRVLEFGCGAGATGAAAKARWPGLEWVGVELFPEAAAVARGVLDQVYEADISTIPASELGAPFDAIVASEVLEHLVDPWQVVRGLAALLRKDGVFIASSPNVASRHVIAELVKGRFEYEQEGVMDQTHLRWFTPTSFARIFSDAGLRVISCEPITPLRKKARLLDWVTGGRFRHLFFNQIVVVAQRV